MLTQDYDGWRVRLWRNSMPYIYGPYPDDKTARKIEEELIAKFAHQEEPVAKEEPPDAS